MLEREKKIMLSEQEYNILVAKNNNVPVTTQRNYYFDTDDLMFNRKGITCRIREINGKYLSTVKNHSMHDGHVSLEENLQQSKEFNPQLFHALGLYEQGVLITNRRILYKDYSCEIALDRNSYLGHTDFEIEVEYAQGCESKAIYLLNNIAEELLFWHLIKDRYEFMKRVSNGRAKSKSERFFERKNALKTEMGFNNVFGIK